MMQDSYAVRFVVKMLCEHSVEQCVQRDENSGCSGEVLIVYVPNLGGGSVIGEVKGLSWSSE